MCVEWVAGSPWNQWPDVHGIGGRMAVESALYPLRRSASHRQSPLIADRRYAIDWVTVAQMWLIDHRLPTIPVGQELLLGQST